MLAGGGDRGGQQPVGLADHAAGTEPEPDQLGPCAAMGKGLVLVDCRGNGALLRFGAAGFVQQILRPKATTPRRPIASSQRSHVGLVKHVVDGGDARQQQQLAAL